MARWFILLYILRFDLTFAFRIGNSRRQLTNRYALYANLLRSNDFSNTEVQINIESNDFVSPKNEQQKRVAIGSQPEFALSDDSTIETPFQRVVLYTHFLTSALNILLVSLNIHINSIPEVFPVILVIITSIIFGDFSTGIFHWSVDNYGSIKTPVFGSVCVAFQGHHNTPWTITFRSFANNVYKICFGAIPALVILAILGDSIAPLTRLFFTLFINWWMVSQEFHKYAHMKNVPPVWKFLQDMGIVLSKKEHGLHHTSPFEGHYCILTGICNSFLDRTKFFRYLERFFYNFTGNVPNTWRVDETLKEIY